MLTGLQFVMLHVSDVQKARAFYTEKLGLEIEGEQPDFVQFKQPAGMGATLAIGKGEEELHGPELWWFVEDAEAFYAKLKGQDVECVSEPHDEPFGRAFAIKDPAGYTLYMLQVGQGS